MYKALQKASELLDDTRVPILQEYFRAIEQIPGANRIFKRIASASNREELENYLTEIRYVMIFVGLEFQVEIEPYGKQGPDLKISRDGHQAVVEIMRFAKIYPGPPEFDLSHDNGIVQEYGDLPRDIRKAFGKILAKLSQVGDDQSIIAIWNDDEDMEEVEVETAVANLRDDANQENFSLPSGLLFVLYGSKWVRTGDGKQLYCFPLRHLDRPYQMNWKRQLESSNVDKLIGRALNYLAPPNS
jgi:hypothetical protein